LYFCILKEEKKFKSDLRALGGKTGKKSSFLSGRNPFKSTAGFLCSLRPE